MRKGPAVFSSRAKVRVRGIATCGALHHAYVHAGHIGLRTKLVPDLMAALDHLAILTLIKERTAEGTEPFETRFRGALTKTMQEIGAEAVENSRVTWEGRMSMSPGMLHSSSASLESHSV